MAYTTEAQNWWNGLTDRECIQCALEAYFKESGLTSEQVQDIIYVVDKPWKWMEEAWFVEEQRRHVRCARCGEKFKDADACAEVEIGVIHESCRRPGEELA